MKRAILAPLLILLGVYLLLNQGGSLGPGIIFAKFWPTLFVIPLGLFFHWLYFSMIGRRAVGVLIPGGILLMSGLTSQAAILLNSWESMWPGFILAVAAGLFEFYWFGSRNKWLLIPINILSVLSLLFFVVFSIGSVLNHLSYVQPLIAILLVLGGVWLITRKRINQ